jgi:hypothetical protein
VTDPATWLTEIVHEAFPEELVVAVHVWAVLPVPSVSTTGCPESATPFEVSWVLSVIDCPTVALVAPVYVTAVVAFVTTKLFDPLLASSVVGLQLQPLPMFMPPEPDVPPPYDPAIA